MKTAREFRHRKELEEFLQELVLQVEKPEEADRLLGILKNLNDSGEMPRGAAHDGRRYDIFKLCPDRIERVGFVRGADNATRMLPHLNALGDAVYFLHHFDGT